MKAIQHFQYAAAAGLLLLPLCSPAQLKPAAKPNDLVVAAKPDLLPTDIRVDRDCRLVVSFRNNGPGAVPDAAFSLNPPGSSVQMYSDGQPWGGIVLGGLDPQKQLKPAGGMLTHHWFPGAANLKLAPGAHLVKVEIDNNHKVAETNEANNALTKKVFCKAALPDLQPINLSLSRDCHVVVTLRNNGPGVVPDAAYASPGSGIQMYMDNQPWGGIILGGFDPSKQTKNAGGVLTKDWFPGAANLKLPPGTHTVKVHVDNNNAVSESSEGNNQLTKQLSCGVSTTPTIPGTGGVLRK